MSILSEPHFHNEEAAYARLESIVWPDGPHCPRCGGFDRITKVNGGRVALWRCGPCKRQFRVTVGTVFEDSKVPLHKWFQAAHLLVSSKKGISAHQLHRTLRVTYKTAWFMEHRLREALRSTDLSPLGGEGRFVESDETFWGKKKGAVLQPNPDVRPGGFGHKMKILSLVERGGSKGMHFTVGKTASKGGGVFREIRTGKFVTRIMNERVYDEATGRAEAKLKEYTRPKNR